MLRFDHLGVVVDDLDAVTAFFVGLGFEPGGPMHVDGEAVDRINGLDGVRAEVVMVSAPDGSGKLELVKYHAPCDTEDAQSAPANRLGYRHFAIQVQDLRGILERLHAHGYDPVGEAQDYGGSWRLVYVRGPEGLIVELAERLT